MLCSLFLFMISGAAFGCPLRSTVFRSKRSERRALSGTGALLTVALGVWAADFGFVDDALLVVGVGRFAEEAAAPPLLGGATIRKAWRGNYYGRDGGVIVWRLGLKSVWV